MKHHANYSTGRSFSPISCIDSGDTPVLAIHGSAATGKQWQSLRLDMEHERRVIAPDLPGYGDNAVANGCEQPGLAGRAQPLLALVQRQQRPVHVVAHSFGAAIALELVRALPQAVLSLWLYEPVVPALLKHGGSDTDLAFLSDLSCLAEMLDRASGPTGMSAFVDFWHGGICWPNLSEKRQALLAAQAPTVLRDFREAFDRPVPIRSLERYTAPVQIAVGEETRPHAERMAALLQALLPNSSRIDFAGMGHMGPCTHEQNVNEVILDWIHCIEGERHVGAVPSLIHASVIA